MSLKIITKEFSCNNQCLSNCCSEIFLPMPPQFKKMFEEHGYWITDNNYCDWEYLSYHKAIVIEKLEKGHRKLSLTGETPFKFIFNPFRGYDELYIQDRCQMILPDHKCKIFRGRPRICRHAECVVFSPKKEIQHYAENGLLKDALKKEKREVFYEI